MNNAQISLIEIPLGNEAHGLARQFAAEQAMLQKRKQVYLNTLAVYAVRCYLGWLGIESDLSQSDSWNLILRNKLDVADLLIPEVGRLECRPVLPGERSIALPAETRCDRIGYLAIQFNEELDRVQLRGFAKVAAQFRLTSLQNLDALVDCLNPKEPIQLRKWLQKTFEVSWHAVDTLLRPEQVDWAFRYGAASRSGGFDSNERTHSISRARPIDFGMAENWMESHKAILVVTITPETEQQTDILVQVHPPADRPHLPANLTLTIVDDLGKPLIAKAGDADNYIQQRFRVEPGEQFSLKLTLGTVSVTENFAI